ncbi:Fungal specific transcription factor domain-containing protein [Cladophialophora immunda]|nr:Fungal specific transcription factor domain-containing protein [Cladophialophora immunda]
MSSTPAAPTVANSQAPDRMSPESIKTALPEKVIWPALERDGNSGDVNTKTPPLNLFHSTSAKTQGLSPRALMQFYEVFICRAHPFLPIVSDLSLLATRIPRLEDISLTASGFSESSNQLPVDHAAEASKALSYAVLASGAQYSDLRFEERTTSVRILVAKSLSALSAADFISRPSQTVLETLLIVIHVLLNELRIQAAWSLMGLIIRLACSLGIPLCSDLTAAYNLPAWKRQMSDMVGWLELALSMSLGRTPTALVSSRPELPETPVQFDDAMRQLCSVVGRTLSSWNEEISPQSVVLGQVTQVQQLLRNLLDNIYSPRSDQQLQLKYQRIAFAVHAYYSIAYLCRPAFTSLEQTGLEYEARCQLVKTCKSSLTEAVRNYLSLLRLTIVASRSGVTRHNGMGAALMLGILGEIRNNQSVRSLVEELLQTLKSDEVYESTSGEAWGQIMIDNLEPMCKEPPASPCDPFLRLNTEFYSHIERPLHPIEKNQTAVWIDQDSSLQDFCLCCCRKTPSERWIILIQSFLLCFLANPPWTTCGKFNSRCNIYLRASNA